MKKSNTSINTQDAVRALSAIAHEGRLTLLRLLIQKGAQGLAAGALARAAEVNAPTASAQLLVLMNAGLVSASRQGRHIIYKAQFQAMSQLLAFLMKDCCGGERDICNPLLKVLRS